MGSRKPFPAGGCSRQVSTARLSPLARDPEAQAAASVDEATLAPAWTALRARPPHSQRPGFRSLCPDMIRFSQAVEMLGGHGPGDWVLVRSPEGSDSPWLHTSQSSWPLPQCVLSAGPLGHLAQGLGAGGPWVSDATSVQAPGVSPSHRPRGPQDNMSKLPTVPGLSQALHNCWLLVTCSFCHLLHPMCASLPPTGNR